MPTGARIRVVIADDHRLFRTGLRLILSREDQIEIVGEAADGLQTIEVVTHVLPDVVLLDATMPRLDGIGVIASLRQKSPAVKPLMLVGVRDEGLIFKALRAGAKGYLSKDTAVPDLVKAIETVYHGELWVERKLIARFFEVIGPTGVVRVDLPGRTNQELTAREEEILRLLAAGGTNKDIGQALFISEKTVKCHLNNIFKKLKVTRRLQAILYVIHQGIR